MEQETASLPNKGVLCVMSMCIRAVFPNVWSCAKIIYMTIRLCHCHLFSNTQYPINNQERMRINTSAGDGVFGSDLEKMWQD